MWNLYELSHLLSVFIYHTRRRCLSSFNLYSILSLLTERILCVLNFFSPNPAETDNSFQKSFSSKLQLDRNLREMAKNFATDWLSTFYLFLSFLLTLSSSYSSVSFFIFLSLFLSMSVSLSIYLDKQFSWCLRVNRTPPITFSCTSKDQEIITKSSLKHIEDKNNRSTSKEKMKRTRDRRISTVVTLEHLAAYIYQVRFKKKLTRMRGRWHEGDRARKQIWAQLPRVDQQW